MPRVRLNHGVLPFQKAYLIMCKYRFLTAGEPVTTILDFPTEGPGFLSVGSLRIRGCLDRHGVLLGSAAHRGCLLFEVSTFPAGALRGKRQCRLRCTAARNLNLKDLGILSEQQRGERVNNAQPRHCVYPRGLRKLLTYFGAPFHCCELERAREAAF